MWCVTLKATTEVVKWPGGSAVLGTMVVAEAARLLKTSDNVGRQAFI